jgi:hypothetical protein
MDAFSVPCENILTRRANQRHYCIITQFETLSPSRSPKKVRAAIAALGDMR